MQYRTLGHSEISVSSIGMGCVTFGREIDEETSLQIMDYAFENGITLFDTAEAYAEGESERVVGNWMKSRTRRDQIVLATKIKGKLTRERIFSSIESSLKRLQTDCIDLLQTHSWDESTPLEVTFDALTTLVAQGKVRYVGCSNYDAAQLAATLKLSEQSNFSRLTSVQPPYNLVQREIEADLLPLCARENVGVISYSPLGAGFLTGKYRSGQSIPAGSRFDVIPGHQPIYFTDHGFRVLEELDASVQSTGLSHVQLALSWVLRQPNITSMLIGARNTSQIDQALQAMSLNMNSKR
ncbi:aldo/keto reductase [Thalassoglobus polymorphus]|uniref:General stress protein 69 n=1 Tax=Thalassoglobus polymorphus TaxID=2527994 RepID=A0A517QNK5_9PLAN|nr:aldo/keto reductase [Thalassoglobus polymorphus]QDT33218.1 General stress protein 69 [Thalassoglobus polymorphus]